MSADSTVPDQDRQNAQAMFPSASTREWLGLALLTLPLFVLALDASVLFLAAPHIGVALAPSATQWLWILDIYGFMIAGFLVTMGAIGDRIGRRRLLMIGSAAFAAASAGAAFSTSPEMLIAARAALGLAGATLMPSTLALIRTMFHDGVQRTRAIAIWMTAFSVGVAFGPLIGGVLLESLWWGSVFLLAVPIMLVPLVAGRLLLPESRDPFPIPIDVISVVLSVGAILAMVYSAKELVTNGPQSSTLLILTVGLLTAILFVYRQRTVANPLVDPKLFASRTFRVSLLVLTMGIFTVTAANFLIPQLLQSVAGLSPLQAGLMSMPIALAAILGSLSAPSLAARWGVAVVIAGGAMLSLGGYLTLAQSRPEGPLWVVIVSGALIVLGLSPVGVLTTDLVVSSAPETRAGSAASLSETSGELGVALGIAVMGTLFTLIYRIGLEGTLPESLPPATLSAVREGLPSARHAAAGLPADLEEAVIGSARSAYASAFSRVAYVCAVLTGALGITSLIGLRRTTPTEA